MRITIYFSSSLPLHFCLHQGSVSFLCNFLLTFFVNRNIFPCFVKMFVLFFSQTVEKFFSKDIKYLVSNKREARYMRCLRQNSSLPDLGQSSPQPCSDLHQGSSNRDNIKSRCQDQTDTVSFCCSYTEEMLPRSHF